MTRWPDRTHNQTHQLREQGHTLQQITEKTGVPKITLLRWFNPEKRRQDNNHTRSYKHRKKHPCVECGTPVWLTSTHCRTCRGATQKKWTPDRILQAINHYTKQHGRPPLSSEFIKQTPRYPSPGTVIDTFGSWANAIEAAGHPRPQIGHKVRNHTQERQLAKQLHQQGHTTKQISDTLRVPPSTIRAYLKSGDRTHRPRKLARRTREQRIADLRKALNKEHNN